jgi:hypothetical protein
LCRGVLDLPIIQ